MTSPEQQWRENWQNVHYGRMRQDEEDLEQTVRRMVLAMEGRQDINAQDFIFAAALGHTAGYETELATLETMLSLEPGNLVTVTRHDGQLHAVGTAATRPVELYVRSGYTDHYILQSGDELPLQRHRILQAILRLDWAYERHTFSVGEAWRRQSVDEYVKTRKHNVLNASGEERVTSLNDDRFAHAFYRPMSVVAGAEGLLAAVEQADEIGRLMAQRAIDALVARSAGFARSEPAVITGAA